MEPLNLRDLQLINDLSARRYSGNNFLSNASLEEKQHLNTVVFKLKELAEHFSLRYFDTYGPFVTSVTSGNPIAIGGTKFKRVWSGIFKGAANKQYAAQISFVVNDKETCLDVGFYFGRASGHSLAKSERIELEAALKHLGTTVSTFVKSDKAIQTRFEDLIDYGFVAYSKERMVRSDEWLDIIQYNPKGSQIVAKIYPNDFGIIEISTIDSFVSQAIFLMAAIVPQDETIKLLKPLTPEQRAKQAERLAQIGQKGELFVMTREQERLSGDTKYPKHVALESMHYGYDILSQDESGDEIYIEVKTTTRSPEDISSRFFFLSNNELETFLANKNRYRIYRVYGIENNPTIEVLNLDELEMKPDGYVVRY